MFISIQPYNLKDSTDPKPHWATDPLTLPKVGYTDRKPSGLEFEGRGSRRDKGDFSYPYTLRLDKSDLQVILEAAIRNGLVEIPGAAEIVQAQRLLEIVTQKLKPSPE